ETVAVAESERVEAVAISIVKAAMTAIAKAIVQSIVQEGAARRSNAGGMGKAAGGVHSAGKVARVTRATGAYPGVTTAEAGMSTEAAGVSATKTTVAAHAPAVTSAALCPNGYSQEEREGRDGHQSAHTA
ncbi:MAG: hypothetical protein ACXVBC_05380, partial [Bdellovibrionota bacterium]